MKRLLFFLLICIGITLQGYAQSDYSFFYFEGDQQTPIYVKMEGQMQPRYGQNHFIIPMLAPGYTHFQILFQQNKYPPQHFLLQVPKGGGRGFVLRKTDSEHFVLYDIQQRKTIPANNTKAEGAASLRRIIPPHRPKLARNDGDNPKDKKTWLSQKWNQWKEQNEKTNPSSQADTLNPSQHLTDSAFISNVVVNGNENDLAQQQQTALSEQHQCAQAMSNVAFENFALRLLNFTDDDAKLKFLKKNANNYCFTTEQVRIIGENLKMQSSRYEMAQILYPRTSDRKNYLRLESLFDTPFMRKKLKEIMISGQ